jgi:hypothetical protein
VLPDPVAAVVPVVGTGGVVGVVGATVGGCEPAGCDALVPGTLPGVAFGTTIGFVKVNGWVLLPPATQPLSVSVCGLCEVEVGGEAGVAGVVCANADAAQSRTKPLSTGSFMRDLLVCSGARSRARDLQSSVQTSSPRRLSAVSRPSNPTVLTAEN